jgi:hypothetical protein
MSGNPLEWRVTKLENDLAEILDRLGEAAAAGGDGALPAIHPGRAEAPEPAAPAEPTVPAAPTRGRTWSLWGVAAGDHVGWLQGWVRWLNGVYAAYPGHRVPPCWARHPGLAAELLTLHYTWRAAFLDGDSPDAAQHWHDYQLPGLLARLPRYLHPHCAAGQHADPADGDPAWSLWGADPDALAAHTPQLSGWIEWLNATYGTAATRRVPACWSQHPGLAAELLTLYYSWRAAYPEGTSLDAAQGWHGADLPGLLTRLPAYVHPGCLRGEHREPIAGVPEWSLSDLADADDPVRLAALRPWVGWLNDVYGTAAAAAHIPACWAQHPGLVAELLTLHHAWQAGFPDGASPEAAQAWHDHALPGLRSRLAGYVHRDCLTGQHQPHRPATAAVVPMPTART